VNHTRFPKEVHLPDWARRDNKVTKTSFRTETCRREVLHIWRDFFDKSKTNLYINHKDNETVAAVEEPAAVQFPGLITRQHGHKHFPCFCYPKIYTLNKTVRKPMVNSSLCPSQFNTDPHTLHLNVSTLNLRYRVYKQYSAKWTHTTRTQCVP